MQAKIGTVIHGTLRTQDLLRACANELERLSVGGYPPIVGEARALADALDDDTPLDGEEECASECLLDMMENYLSPLAPEGCYFGAHPGDASDFGFWECDIY